MPEKWQRPGLPRPSALEGCCSMPVHAWTPSACLPGELGALPHSLYLHTARAGSVFNSLIVICILHVASQAVEMMLGCSSFLPFPNGSFLKHAVPQH